LESGIAAADGGSFRVVASDWVKSRNFQAGIDQFQPAMTKPKDACQVLGELEAVYGAKLTDTQKADAGRQRTKAKCTA
jgi:hypothetical protein